MKHYKTPQDEILQELAEIQTRMKQTNSDLRMRELSYLYAQRMQALKTLNPK